MVKYILMGLTHGFLQMVLTNGQSPSSMVDSYW